MQQVKIAIVIAALTALLPFVPSTVKVDGNGNAALRIKVIVSPFTARDLTKSVVLKNLAVIVDLDYPSAIVLPLSQLLQIYPFLITMTFNNDRILQIDIPLRFVPSPNWTRGALIKELPNLISYTSTSHPSVPAPHIERRWQPAGQDRRTPDIERISMQKKGQASRCSYGSACSACRRAKRKCDLVDGSPCTRCTARGDTCSGPVFGDA